MITIFLIAVLPLAFTAALFCALPYWHGDRLLFGVTVPPGFRNQPLSRDIIRTYRFGVLTASVLAAALCCWALSRNLPWVFGAGTLSSSIVAVLLYARAHRRILPHRVPASTVRVAPLGTDSEHLPGGWLTTLVPFVLLAATALYLQQHWNSLPTHFPVHWSASGVPNRWSTRSVRGVYGPLAVAALICLFILTMNWGLLHGARRGGTDAESQRWHARFRHATLRMMVAVMWILSGMFSWIALFPILNSSPHEPALVLPMIGVTLVLIFAFAWPLVRLSMEPGAGPDGTPDECWKWGGIYYNPQDPALMVERRFGIGYTINLGNRTSWLLLAVMFTMLAGITLIAHAI